MKGRKKPSSYVTMTGHVTRKRCIKIGVNKLKRGFAFRLERWRCYGFAKQGTSCPRILLKTYGIRSEAELLAEFAKLQPLSIEALVSRPNIAAVKSA